MEFFSSDMGFIVNRVLPENPYTIYSFVNPACTALEEIGSFEEYCIGHYGQEWIESIQEEIECGQIPVTEKAHPICDEEFIKAEDGYIYRIEFSRKDQSHFFADVILVYQISVSSRRGDMNSTRNFEQWYRLRNIFEIESNLYSILECSVSIYHKEDANPGLPMSKYLVPVLSADGIEEEAENLLMQYYPEAMLELPVDGELLAERMGLQVIALPFSDEEKIMGKAIFNDTDIRLNTTAGEKIVRIHPRTIVVNSKYKQYRNQWNTIIIHECCHFYEHDLFIWGQTQYNEQLVGIDCPITRGRYPLQGKSPVFWAERQARMMTYRVKMNKPVTRAKAEEYRQQYWRVHPNGSEEEQFQKTIYRLATFFGVSRPAARNRLVEVGFPEAQGLMNSVDGKYIHPFYYSEGVLQGNQTFLIGVKDAVQLYARSENFRELINSGAYIYIEGRFCINQPEYIVIGEDGKPRFTEYARQHTEACCLRFDRDGKYGNPNYSWGELHLEYRTSFTTNGVWCPQCAAEPGLCDPTKFTEDVSWSVTVRKKISGMDFGDALKTLMGIREMSVEEMEAVSGISVSTIKRLRAGQEATAEQILAISVALQLPPGVSNDLLKVCGITLEYNSTKNTVYQLIMASMYRAGIDQVNSFLVAAGCKPLKTAC